MFGVINVWGIPGEGTNFFLIVLITESEMIGSHYNICSPFNIAENNIFG